jgi:hypothetical protein
MVGEIYNGYHIIVSAKYDETTRAWIPKVEIVLTSRLHETMTIDRSVPVDLKHPRLFPELKRC